ncbi:hypothetical protein [Saccharothrix stipae]
MEGNDQAEDDDPEHGEERRSGQRYRSDQAIVLLGVLVQVVALIAEISDLIR